MTALLFLLVMNRLKVFFQHFIINLKLFCFHTKKSKFWSCYFTLAKWNSHPKVNWLNINLS